MTMPNFCIIGAPKAGTSSLYEYVKQHPDVYMSPVKEPGYFKPGGTWEPDRPISRTVDEYEALFDGVTSERAVGEATASYLQSAASARLLREALPDAKLIAILRNPVDRAYSGYSMRVSQGTEDLSFAEAMAHELEPEQHPDETRRWKYLGPGFYGKHLSVYFDLFPREQLSVHLYEELSKQPATMLREVFEFLGVDPTFEPDITYHNVTRYPVKHAGVDGFIRRVPGKAMLRKVVPQHAWARAKRSARRRNSKVPEFPPALRRRLADLYLPDIRLTEELVGRDLSAWTAGVNSGA